MFTHRNIKLLQASLLIQRINIYSLILKYRECLEQISSKDKTGSLIQELDGEGKSTAADEGNPASGIELKEAVTK